MGFHCCYAGKDLKIVYISSLENKRRDVKTGLPDRKGRTFIFGSPVFFIGKNFSLFAYVLVQNTFCFAYILEQKRVCFAYVLKQIALFNIYTLIGGMPEVVSNYAFDGDIVSLNRVYETMLEGYRDDVEKYAKGGVLSDVIRYILTEGWAFAGQSITLGSFAGSPYKAREVGEAFRTLAKTLLLELVYPPTSASVPLVSDLKRSPKLLWLDTGLVNYAAGLQKEIFGASDITDAWRGMIAEQVVGQELLALSNKVSQRRHFWMRGKVGSSAEVDFVYLYDSKIIPVEVKSGHNAKLRSIHSFMDEAPHEWAVRVWRRL